MPSRLTGTVTVTLARNYRLDHQTVLRIYNTHFVLEATTEGKVLVTAWGVAQGSFVIYFLLRRLHSPNKHIIVNQQKCAVTENKTPVSKGTRFLHRCFSEHFTWEIPQITTSNNQNYVKCHLLHILLRSHKSCSKNHLSSVFRKGLQRQDCHWCDHGEVLITNIVTHEMQILYKDTWTSMCHWA